MNSSFITKCLQDAGEGGSDMVGLQRCLWQNTTELAGCNMSWLCPLSQRGSWNYSTHVVAFSRLVMEYYKQQHTDKLQPPASAWNVSFIAKFNHLHLQKEWFISLCFKLPLLARLNMLKAQVLYHSFSTYSTVWVSVFTSYCVWSSRWLIQAQFQQAMTDISLTPSPQRKEQATLLFPTVVLLTAIIAERRELDSLLSVAGAVVDLHLQLVPGGLLQVIQDVALGEGGALCRGPCGWLYRPILQGEGGDRAATVIPAVQVEFDPGGVDAGEELLFFGVLRFCRARGRNVSVCWHCKNEHWQKLKLADSN